MHITLYRKYRPKDFNEVSGEHEIVETLKNSLKNNKLAHAYLFSGPRGVGKTSIARLIAKGVNCLTNGITDSPCGECDNCKEISNGSFMDLLEIDAASNRGIDEIKLLKEKINYLPSRGRKKIYIIDEVHMLTKEAFNALLKTLEEPPEHALFILATTEPDKILPTIISRCQRYDFKTINYPDMKEKLEYISKEEGYGIDEESLELIFEASAGSMRDSISILERLLINSDDKKIVSEKTEKILGIAPIKLINQFIKTIENKNKEEAIEVLENIWKESIDNDLFFKSLAKRTKDLIVENSIDVELGLKIIDVVYEILQKFKYEEDNRLIGYVIINRLLAENKKEIVIEKTIEIEKIVEKNSNQNIKDTGYDNEESIEEIVTNNIKFEDVKNSWSKIIEESRKNKVSMGAFLMKAKLKDFVKNTIIVEFSNEQNFSKEMLESEPYKTTFLEIARKVLNSKITIKCELEKGNIINIKEEKEDFSKKVIDFFDGEML